VALTGDGATHSGPGGGVLGRPLRDIQEKATDRKEQIVQVPALAPVRQESGALTPGSGNVGSEVQRRDTRMMSLQVTPEQVDNTDLELQ
jgi:hypothetical protein